MLLARSWVGRLTERAGTRTIVLVSLAVTVVGMLPFAFAGSRIGRLLLGAAQIVNGAVLNGLQLPIIVTACRGLGKGQVPHANVPTRIFQTIGEIGERSTSAVLVTVIDHRLYAGAASCLSSVAMAYPSAC